MSMAFISAPASLARRAAQRLPARSATLLMALFLCLASWLPTASHADDDPQARLEAIEADLEALERRLAGARDDRDTLAAELKRSDLALAELARDVRSSEQEIRASRAELERLQNDIEALQTRQEATRSALRGELRQSWLIARRGPLQTLLEAEAPDRLARLLAFHEYLARARLQAQQDYRAATLALRAAETAVSATQQTLLAQRDLLERQVAGLQRVRAERQRLLADLEAEIDAGEDTRTALATERDDLQALIERLDAEAFDGTGESFAASQGKLPWPISERSMLQAPRADGRTGGMLLRAEEGSTVRAIHAGRVVFADWMRGFGLLVILDHGGGFMSLYGQAEALLRNVGDVVEAGDGLATTGRSGGRSRAGVWFGIRKNGKPEAPDRWCTPI